MMGRSKQALIAAVAAALTVATAEGSEKLPLREGTYASNPDFCGMPRDLALRRTEAAFIDVQALRVRYYESVCSISKLRVGGSIAIFRERCAAEGEVENRTARWTIISPSSFGFRGRTYRLCVGRAHLLDVAR